MSRTWPSASTVWMLPLLISVTFLCRVRELAARPNRSVGAGHHHPAHHAPFAVVGDRQVLHRPVVPECHRAHLPAEAALELGRLQMLIEEAQEGVALGLGQLDDLGGPVAV